MSIKPVLLSVALLSGLCLFAQHNEEVTIEGTYRPKVNKVDKILMQADAPQPTFEMPSADVNVMEIQHRFPIQLERISAQALNNKGQKGLGQTKNFLLAGIGTRLSPVFLYKHNSMLTKTLGIGVGIKHYSTWLGIKDYAYSGMMNNTFDLGLSSSRFKGFQLNGNLYYKNDVVHYYGINTTTWTGSEEALELAAPRQAYNTVGTRIALTPTSTRNRELVHNASFDYHYLFSTLEAKEHAVDLRYGLGYTNNWWGDKAHPQKIGVDLALYYNNYCSVNNTLFAIRPYLEMKDEFYRLRVGFRFDATGKAVEGSSKVALRPELQGSLYVLDKKVEFYAGLNGGRRLLTYSEVVGENPFVGNDLQLLLTNVKLGFEGGVRTNIMNTLDMHLGVRYRHTENDPFYTVVGQMTDDQLLNNTYTLVYDETKVVSVLADARWLAMDRLTVDAGFTYNKYRMAWLDQPLYRPATEGRLKVNYDLNDNLALYSSFLYQGGRYGRLDPPLVATPSFKMKPVLDLGIGADYKVKDELTVFGRIDNLLHQKYQLFANYPVTGIQFFAGVKMRF